MNIRVGTLSDFFGSLRETARELDRGERVTPKQRVWVVPEDFVRLLKPKRMELIRYLRGKERVNFNDLVADLRRPEASLRRDVQLLVKYQLAQVIRERSVGNGVCNVIKPNFGTQMIEVNVEI